MPTYPLPVNIDATYADSGTDASQKLHQQYHDQLHAKLNALVVDVQADFGATGDGTTNDTTAIQSALNVAGIVYFPPGTYIANGLTIPSNTHLRGAGQSTILKQVAGVADNTYLLSSFGTGTTVSTNKTNVTISDMQLLGRSDVDTFTQFVHLVCMSGVSDVQIERVQFKSWRGDAFYLGSNLSGGTAAERHNERVTITDCVFDGVQKNNRNGVTIIEGTDVKVLRSHFTRCSAAGMPGAIDIEPNNFAYLRVRNIEIAGNTFDDVGGAVGCITVDIVPAQSTLTVPAQHFHVHHNTIRNYTGTTAGIYFRHRQTNSDTTARNDIVMEANIIEGCATPLYFEGIRGGKVLNNYFGTSANALAIGYEYRCKDLIFEGNTFEKTGTTEGTCLAIYKSDRLQIRNNVFDTIGLANGSTGRLVSFNLGSGSVGSSTFTDFTHNTIRGTTATTISSKNASHTLTATQNAVYFNDTSLVPAIGTWNKSYNNNTPA